MGREHLRQFADPRLLRDAKERRAHWRHTSGRSMRKVKRLRWLADMISIKQNCKLEGLTPQMGQGVTKHATSNIPAFYVLYKRHCLTECLA